MSRFWYDTAMWSLITLPRDEIKKIWRMLKNPDAPKAPRYVVAALLLYIIWPADLIPDVAPLLGWADDLGFFGFTLWWLHKEVDRLST